jgi:hypothetical protein
VFVCRRGSPISAQEATLHAQAMRINAGRASSFRFFEDGQSGVLLACSLTLGAVAFEWRFDKVVGMRGPATIGTVIQVTCVCHVFLFLLCGFWLVYMHHYIHTHTY